MENRVPIGQAALRAGIGLVALTLGPVAHAQSNPPGGAAAAGSEPGDVVVTASKREESLLSVPISITVSSGADLMRRGATQIDDIVASAPGLSNSGGGPNQANLVMRGVTTGVSAGLQQSTVALFIDDLPTDPGAGALGTSDLRLFDVQRVEVLRGPQGTLFGSGSLSGAVRILTNRPDLDRLGAGFEASGSTTRGGRPSGDGNAMINLPLIDGRLGVRAVGYASDTGGYIDNVLTGRSDVNWVHQYGGRLMILAKPIDSLSILLTAAYQQSQPGASGSSSYAPPRGVSRDNTEATLVEATARLSNAIINIVTTADFGSVSLTSSTSYSRRRLLAIGNASGYVTLVGALLGAPNLVEATSSYLPSNSDTITQEIRLASTGKGPLRWTIGAYYQDLDGRGGYSVRSPAIGALIGVETLADLKTTTPVTESALFGEASYALGDKLDLAAGLRFGHIDQSFTTRATGVLMTNSFDPTEMVVHESQKESAVTPRFSLTYRPTRDLTFYAQAARGFRTGGPNLTAGLSPAPPPLTYQSDSLWNYELGTKSRWFNGRLRLDVTAYLIDWSNIQASLYQGIAYIGNAGNAHIYGFEGEAAAHPWAWLDFGGSFSFSHSELTKDVGNLSRTSGLIGVTAGDRLPASLEIKISSFLQGSFALAGRNGYVRLDHQYVGVAYSDFGLQGARFGGFNSLALRGGIDLGRIEFIAFVNNLFDSKGKVSAMDPTFISGVPLSEKTAIRLRPRTIGLTIRGSF